MKNVPFWKNISNNLSHKIKHCPISIKIIHFEIWDFKIWCSFSLVISLNLSQKRIHSKLQKILSPHKFALPNLRTKKILRKIPP